MNTLYQGTVGLRRKSVHEEEGPLAVTLYLLTVAAFVVVGFAV